MPRPAKSRLSPWIESLILRYGSPEEGSSSSSSSSGILKAYVIGTGQMPQSQVQGPDSPTGLLFLSDGMLRIPAVLTAAAWEHLQDQEDRESFTSLLNTTVCLRDYRLQFHMAPEQTKCRFFLSVGELRTTAAGPDRDNTPCCTTLPSVKLKICQTWRAVHEQNLPETEESQSGLDLTELLGEWQLDCMQSAVDDVKERIMELRGSSSGCASPPDGVGTGWDVDRVRYKGETPFAVPLKCLIIPDKDTLQLPVTSRVPAACEAARTDPSPLPEATQASVHAAAWRVGELPVLPIDPCQGSPLCPEDKVLQDDMIIELPDSSVRPLSNPWDLFPPPHATSLSSDASPLETTPTELTPDLAGFDCGFSSTQVGGDSSSRCEKALESSKEESSFLTPYQKTQGSSSAIVPAVSVKASRSLNEVLAAEELRTDASQEHPPLERECHNLEQGTVERRCGKAKRKRDEFPLPTERREEHVLLSLSPRSWLCDTPAGSRFSQGIGDHHQRSPVRQWASARTPRVHSDGTPFSYSYNVSGQNLMDLSHFKVTGSCLKWAVKYLLAPKQNDNGLHTLASGQSNVT